MKSDPQQQSECQDTQCAYYHCSFQIQPFYSTLAGPFILLVVYLQDLAFVPMEFGKPVLDCRLLPKRAKYIDFNVTDTQGLLAVAVACGVKAGLDLERLDRTLRFSPEQIARKKFSPAEQAQFLGVEPVSTTHCSLPGKNDRVLL